MNGGYVGPTVERYAAAVAHATLRPEPVDPATLTPADFAALPTFEKHRIHRTDPGLYAALRDGKHTPPAEAGQTVTPADFPVGDSAA